MPTSGPPAPIWCEMTMMAMAHPRRYLSLSAVGAIAIRLPPTSSRIYTSSVRDPLANTSNTSSAASSVASGRPSIICSTAARGTRFMRTSSERCQAYPTTARAGKTRSTGQAVGARPAPGGRAHERETLDTPGERVGGPGPRRHDRNPCRPGGDRSDARQERAHLVARDEKRDGGGGVVAAGRCAEVPALDPRALDQAVGEPPKLVDVGRPAGALRARAFRAVAAVQAQELHAHLHGAAELGECGADARRVGGEPGGELARRHHGAEAKRQERVRGHRRRDDLVVAGERLRRRRRDALAGAREHVESLQRADADRTQRGHG